MMADLTLDQAQQIESQEANAWGQAKSQEAVNAALDGKPDDITVAVQATEGENQKLSVTQTTTETTTTSTSEGQIVTRVIHTITDIISNDEDVKTQFGNVSTMTITTTTVDGKSTSVIGPTTTESRNTADVSALTKIDNHLENFKIAHHQQFNKSNGDHWNSVLGISSAGGMVPFQVVIGFLKAIPESVSMFLDVFGKPASAIGGANDGVKELSEHVTSEKPVNLFNSKNGYIFYDHFQVIKKMGY